MALSLLDCAESDRPLPIPVPVRSFGLVDSVYTITEADTTLYVPVRRSCGCGSAWVRYERDLYHPQLMTSLSSSIEFTLADSIGIVQAGWGEFSTMGGLWTMRSWSAELVSCLLSR